MRKRVIHYFLQYSLVIYIIKPLYRMYLNSQYRLWGLVEMSPSNLSASCADGGLISRSGWEQYRREECRRVKTPVVCSEDRNDWPEIGFSVPRINYLVTSLVGTKKITYSCLETYRLHYTSITPPLHILNSPAFSAPKTRVYVHHLMSRIRYRSVFMPFTPWTVGGINFDLFWCRC